MNTEDRQTGRTTKQLEKCPVNSIFVWCNGRTDYAKKLAHKINRDDIIIKPFSWYNARNIRGSSASITLDHACPITKEVLEADEYISMRDNSPEE